MIIIIIAIVMLIVVIVFVVILTVVILAVDIFSNLIHFTIRDIKRLQGHGWLNDQIINFYFTMINLRQRVDIKVLALETFFIISAVTKGANKAWGMYAREEDLFDHDLILIPVNKGNDH